MYAMMYRITGYFCSLKLLRFENLDKSFNYCKLHFCIQPGRQLLVHTCTCVGTVTSGDSEDRPKYVQILFVHFVITSQNLQKCYDCRNNQLYGKYFVIEMKRWH